MVSWCDGSKWPHIQNMETSLVHVVALGGRSDKAKNAKDRHKIARLIAVDRRGQYALRRLECVLLTGIASEDSSKLSIEPPTFMTGAYVGVARILGLGSVCVVKEYGHLADTLYTA